MNLLNSKITQHNNESLYMPLINSNINPNAGKLFIQFNTPLAIQLDNQLYIPLDNQIILDLDENT